MSENWYLVSYRNTVRRIAIKCLNTKRKAIFSGKQTHTQLFLPFFAVTIVTVSCKIVFDALEITARQIIKINTALTDFMVYHDPKPLRPQTTMLIF